MKRTILATTLLLMCLSACPARTRASDKVGDLVQGLLSDETSARAASRAAIESLSETSKLDLVARLEPSLNDEKNWMRGRAASAMAAVGQDCLPFFEKHLGSKKLTDRRAAALGLHSFLSDHLKFAWPPALEETLLRGLSDEDPLVRRSMVDCQADGLDNPKGHSRNLVPLLKDPYWEVRACAALGLSSLDRDKGEFLPDLVKAVAQETDESVVPDMKRALIAYLFRTDKDGENKDPIAGRAVGVLEALKLLWPAPGEAVPTSLFDILDVLAENKVPLEKEQASFLEEKLVLLTRAYLTVDENSTGKSAFVQIKSDYEVSNHIGNAELEFYSYKGEKPEEVVAFRAFDLLEKGWMGSSVVPQILEEYERTDPAHGFYRMHLLLAALANQPTNPQVIRWFLSEFKKGKRWKVLLDLNDNKNNGVIVPILAHLIGNLETDKVLLAVLDDPRLKKEKGYPAIQRTVLGLFQLGVNPKIRTNIIIVLRRILAREGEKANYRVSEDLNLLSPGWKKVDSLKGSDDIKSVQSRADEVPRVLEFYRTGKWNDAEVFEYLRRFGVESVPFLPLISELALKNKENLDYAERISDLVVQLGPEAVSLTPLLTKYLGSDDFFFRKIALESIHKIGPGSSQAASLLAERLSSPIEDESVRAAEILAELKIPEPKAIAAIKRAYDGKDAIHREAAVRILARMGLKDREAAVFFLKALGDTDKHVRWSALEGLSPFVKDDPEVQARIIPFIPSDEVSTCLALKAFKEAGPLSPGAREAIGKIDLRKANSPELGLVLDLLPAEGDSGISLEKGLLDRLANFGSDYPDPRIGTVVLKMDPLAGPKVGKILEQKAGSKNPRDVLWATIQLHECGLISQGEYLSRLKGLLGEENPAGFRLKTAVDILKLDPKDPEASQVVTQYPFFKEEEMSRFKDVWADLPECRTSLLIPFLQKGLAGPVRLEVLYYVFECKIQDPAFIQPLIELMGAPEEASYSRVIGRLALEGMGPVAVPALVKTLGSPNKTAQFAALAALMRIDTPESKGAVEKYEKILLGIGRTE